MDCRVLLVGLVLAGGIWVSVIWVAVILVDVNMVPVRGAWAGGIWAGGIWAGGIWVTVIWVAVILVDVPLVPDRGSLKVSCRREGEGRGAAILIDQCQPLPIFSPYCRAFFTIPSCPTRNTFTVPYPPSFTAPGLGNEPTVFEVWGVPP